MDIITATAYAILLHLPQMGFWLLAGALALKQTDINLKQLLEAIKTDRQKDRKAREGSRRRITTSQIDDLKLLNSLTLATDRGAS